MPSKKVLFLSFFLMILLCLGTGLARKLDFYQQFNLSQAQIEKDTSIAFSCFKVPFSVLFSGETFLDNSESGDNVDLSHGDIKDFNVKAEEVLRVKIGSGPDDLGVITPSEANPEGPMSFAVSPAGEIYVLDQTNARIQVFANKRRIKTIAIPGKTFSDLELLPNGQIALLDNVARKEVVILDDKGKESKSISLKQKEISDPGAVVGIYYRGKGNWPGLWAQMDNYSILIADSTGKAASPITSLPGLIDYDGHHLLKVEIEEDKLVIVSQSDEGGKNWKNYKIGFKLPVGQIYGLWENDKGNIYLAINLYNEEKEANQVVILDARGNELSRVALYVPVSPNEIFFPVKITSDGSIYQLAIEGKEIAIRKYSGI
jgi:DNA-binding beta-propeller fold protein YncE